LLNAQENAHPDLLPATGAPSQSVTTYYYRGYSRTNSYLGISSADNHLYYVGTNGKMQDQGAVAGLMMAAGCK
jgi:hypothetical protein